MDPREVDGGGWALHGGDLGHVHVRVGEVGSDAVVLLDYGVKQIREKSIKKEVWRNMLNL